jgi:hypothetical protein
MNDLVGDALRPRSKDLYRSFLLHPAIKPFTDAFQIETAPPSWLDGMSIEEFDLRQEEIENWWNTSRCLLLDRRDRRFFVDTVSEIRRWLILRGALNTDRVPWIRKPSRSPKLTEQALANWLEGQPVPRVSKEFVAEWERQFRRRVAIAGCTAAALKLGFDADDVRSMMGDAFGYRGNS